MINSYIEVWTRYFLLLHDALHSFKLHRLCAKYLRAAAAKLLQSCPTLCDPLDGSPPGSPVPGTLQTRALEWVAISSSNAWKWKMKVKLLSRVWPLATPWTAAYQALASMGFSRQKYWSGMPLPCSTSQIIFGEESGIPLQSYMDWHFNKHKILYLFAILWNF